MPDSLDTRWNSTDSGDPQKRSDGMVHITATPSPKAASKESDDHVPSYVRVDPSRASMQVAALSGIALVLLAGVTFYFGVDYLRASLTDSGHTVTVTADGVFSPDTISVRPGDSVLFTNEHPDPQVLKLKDGAGIAPVVLFEGESESVTLPDFIPAGTYEIYSETLPEDVVLTIRVSQEEPSIPADTAQDEDPFPMGEILIPQLGDFAADPVSDPSASDTPTRPAALPSPPPVAPSVPVQDPSEAGNVDSPSVFDLDTGVSSSGEIRGSTSVPVNPYVVGSEQRHPVPQAQQEQLRPGAPLNKLPVHTETGTGIWVFASLAGLATFGGFRVIGKRSA